MKRRRALCSCGQLSLVCIGEPVRVSICHCFACQRRTGSVFGAQARFPRDKITEVRGLSSEFVRVGDSGGRASLQFCSTCGSTVYWTLDGLPDFVMVALGAFADPDFPKPTVSVYEARQHPWVDFPELELEHIE